MCQCQTAFCLIDNNRLRISPAVSAGGSVTHMTHGHVAAPQFPQHRLCENFIDQADILERGEHTVLTDCHACGFLPAVLKCKKTVIDKL